jgi:hypothetical protein
MHTYDRTTHQHMRDQLAKVFWTAFTRLPQAEKDTLAEDTIGLANDEGVDLYRAARMCKARIGGADNLASYAALIAGGDR